MKSNNKSFKWLKDRKLSQFLWRELIKISRAWERKELHGAQNQQTTYGGPHSPLSREMVSLMSVWQKIGLESCSHYAHFSCWFTPCNQSFTVTSTFPNTIISNATPSTLNSAKTDHCSQIKLLRELLEQVNLFYFQQMTICKKFTLFYIENMIFKPL